MEELEKSVLGVVVKAVVSIGCKSFSRDVIVVRPLHEVCEK